MHILRSSIVDDSFFDDSFFDDSFFDDSLLDDSLLDDSLLDDSFSMPCRSTPTALCDGAMTIVRNPAFKAIWTSVKISRLLPLPGPPDRQYSGLAMISSSLLDCSSLRLF